MHPRLLLLPAFVLLGCAGFATSSDAMLPNAANSTIPACMPACPLGDIVYTVVIRDIAGVPMKGVLVTLDFSTCAGVHFCPAAPPPLYSFLSPTAIQLATDATVQAAFPLEVGGTCAGAVQVSANGVLMTDGIAHPLATLAGLDQDADSFVTPLDAAILAAKGPADPTADVNCDGMHDAADDALLAAHLMHFCRGLIDPVHGRTWGQLKLIYR